MTQNIDLHVHSYFAYSTSKDLTLSNLLIKKRIAGIDLIGTGDILHTEWYNVISARPDLIYKDLIPTVEIASHNLHYLIILPNLSVRNDLYNAFKPYSKNIDQNGRPAISLEPKQIAEICKTYNCLFGLAHAFSPYTGHFAKNKSMDFNVDFIELGLDATKEDCLNITQIKDIPFIKGSDCHSLKSLGREYIVSDNYITSFEDLKMMFEKNTYRMISSICSINKWYGDFSRKNKVYKGVNSIVNSLKTETNIEKDNTIYRLPLRLLLSTYYNISSESKLDSKILQLTKQESEHAIFLNYATYEFGKYFFIENINILETGGGNIPGKISLKD